LTNTGNFNCRQTGILIVAHQLLHSCISHEEGKKNVHRRFINLVENEFRNKALILLETYKKYPQLINKEKAFKRIVELNSNIGKCKNIWQKYAYQD